MKSMIMLIGLTVSAVGGSSPRKKEPLTIIPGDSAPLLADWRYKAMKAAKAKQETEKAHDPAADFDDLTDKERRP